MKIAGYLKILGVLLLLIVFGVWFVLGVASEPARWAVVGAAIGGICSPVIAGLTLFVLWRQLRLQEKLTIHEFDQAYVQQARQDIEFYGPQLEAALNAVINSGVSMRFLLRQRFRFLVEPELQNREFREFARNIHQEIPSVFDLWTAIIPLLNGLNAGKAPAYVLAFESSKQKLIALLSFPTCMALDNYYIAVAPVELKMKTFFSEIP